jgi:transcriptional regulator with XRE-family HTH domain
MRKFGAELRRAREQAGLSQVEVARRIGIDASYVAHVEAGRRNPTLRAMDAFARALDLDLSFLFSER